MTQLQNRWRYRQALRTGILLLLASVFAVFSSDAVHGRWAYQPQKTITVNGQDVVVDDTLALNPYTKEDFVRASAGRMACTAGGYQTGVDVSSHQGEIDWKAVAEDGIQFAMVRLGFRGYSEGSLNLDECFRKNLRGAAKNGLAVGVYFFSQAISVAEAEEEADFVLKALDGASLSLPVVFDWEVIDPEEAGEAGARTDETDQQTVTACALAFLEKLQTAGYQGAVYCGKYTGYFSYDIAQLQDTYLWFASYDQGWPDYYYALDLWQYTSTGSVSGIQGDVDLDMAFVGTDPADSPSGSDAGSSASVTPEASARSLPAPSASLTVG